MTSPIDDFGARIARRAVTLELGGFRPSDEPTASWFGRVSACAPGESWPRFDARPMHALAQIDLRGFPYRTPGTEDLELLAVFIGPDELPVDAPNGERWLVRAYPDASVLVPLEPVDSGSPAKALPMRPRALERDYPCWEGVAEDCPDELDGDYLDLFANADGFKFGGWPTLIQAEVRWGGGAHAREIRPEHVFQIDSTDEGRWSWGDGGVGYFGRGTAPGLTDRWTLDWQCY